VDIYVDKPPLTRQTALNGGVFYKLPIQQADLNAFKINDLAAQALTPENIPKKFLST
jgi:hypothetical protein